MAAIKRFLCIVGLLPKGAKSINAIEFNHSLFGLGEVFACRNQLLELALFDL